MWANTKTHGMVTRRSHPLVVVSKTRTCTFCLENLWIWRMNCSQRILCAKEQGPWTAKLALLLIKIMKYEIEQFFVIWLFRGKSKFCIYIPNIYCFKIINLHEQHVYEFVQFLFNFLILSNVYLEESPSSVYIPNKYC